MTRPATLILFALSIAAGGLLFAVAFEVSALEDRLQVLNKDITRDRNAIHVLRAEWSYLNQPERLEGLTQRYLELQPLTGAQISGPNALALRRDDAATTRQADAPAAAPPADVPQADDAKGAGEYAAVPKQKPAPPRQPARAVQLASQPLNPAAVVTPDDPLETALRAVLGDAVGGGAGGRR